MLNHIHEQKGMPMRKSHKTIAAVLFLFALVFIPTFVLAEEVFQTGDPIYVEEPKDLRAYPTDPRSDISWDTGFSSVSDIKAAFDAARTHENQELGTSVSMLSMPSDSEWNAMSDGAKMLYLLNQERIDRGVTPLNSLETNVMGVSQAYAEFLLNNNLWGHTEDGKDPWQRMDENPTIGNCREFLNIGENLAVFMTTASSIAMPIERSVYGWMYDDGNCCTWGHRHAILWYPYNDNSGEAGKEGFLGVGRASGPYDGWNFGEMIVMNVFDPCASWDYSTAIETGGGSTTTPDTTNNTTPDVTTPVDTSGTYTQTDVDAAYQAGRAACISDPASCGIQTSSCAITQGQQSDGSWVIIFPDPKTVTEDNFWIKIDSGIKSFNEWNNSRF